MTFGPDDVHVSLLQRFRAAVNEEARLDPRFAPASCDQITRYADAHRRSEQIRQQIRELAPGPDKVQV